MRLALLLLLLAMIPLLGGCETAPDHSADGSGAAVSSIPWNKPASWEGTGALGGFAPQAGGR